MNRREYMKKLLVGLLVLGSFSAFSDEFKCNTNNADRIIERLGTVENEVHIQKNLHNVVQVCHLGNMVVSWTKLPESSEGKKYFKEVQMMTTDYSGFLDRQREDAKVTPIFEMP
jgi:hypothetical protein